MAIYTVSARRGHDNSRSIDLRFTDWMLAWQTKNTLEENGYDTSVDLDGEAIFTSVDQAMYSVRCALGELP